MNLIGAQLRHHVAFLHAQTGQIVARVVGRIAQAVVGLGGAGIQGLGGEDFLGIHHGCIGIGPDDLGLADAQCGVGTVAGLTALLHGTLVLTGQLFAGDLRPDTGVEDAAADEEGGIVGELIGTDGSVLGHDGHSFLC